MERARKILTVFGTRPEAIKLFPLLHHLERDPRFTSRVLVTGQHRAMLDQVLGMAKVVPDHDLALMQAGQSLDQLTARALTGIGEILGVERPDWVVVQGDTTTAFAGALAAYYRQIPVCHVEAGLRSGNIYHPWPEEVNRRALASMATLHCAPTRAAAEALIARGAAADSVQITGNTVIDALQWVTRQIWGAPHMAAQIRPLERRFAGRRIIAVTCHRRENWGDGLMNIAKSVKEIASRNDVAVIFPLHLNPKVRSVMMAQLGGLENVVLTDPLDYPNFTHLLNICHLVLTDSGGVQEEAPALGKPVLVMRETTERPEGVEAGTAMLVGTNPQRIVAEVNRLLDNDLAYRRMAIAHNPYGDGQAAPRIVQLLAGAGQKQLTA